MRTTLNIEEEAYLLIKKYAAEREISLGQATSDLVHRGAENLPEFKMKNGWVIFDMPPGQRPLTNEQLEEWEQQDYQEEYQRAISPRR